MTLAAQKPRDVPPSTGMVVPVTYPASALSSSRTMQAMSSGWAMRPSGESPEGR